MPGNEDEAAGLLDAYLERADTRARTAQLDSRAERETTAPSKPMASVPRQPYTGEAARMARCSGPLTTPLTSSRGHH